MGSIACRQNLLFEENTNDRLYYPTCYPNCYVITLKVLSVGVNRNTRLSDFSKKYFGIGV